MGLTNRLRGIAVMYAIVLALTNGRLSVVGGSFWARQACVRDSLGAFPAAEQCSPQVYPPFGSQQRRLPRVLECTSAANLVPSLRRLGDLPSAARIRIR